MLLTRIKEIDAIARLKEVSRTDEFQECAYQGGQESHRFCETNIVTDPVNTISNAPKGLMKFMRRAGESIKDVGNKSESHPAEGSRMQRLIGFSDEKRKVAISLDVDPYSTTTQVLQHELDGIAWASFAGGMTVQLATMPIGGPALTVVDVTSTLNDVHQGKSLLLISE